MEAERFARYTSRSSSSVENYFLQLQLDASIQMRWDQKAQE